MKKIKITEAQLKMLGKQLQTNLNESHISSIDLSEDEKSFLEGYYDMDEGKKATIHHHAAQGNSKSTQYYDGTYDTGDVKKKITLNDYYRLQGGDDAMTRLAYIKPDLVDIAGDEYIFVDYEARGERGIKVKVKPKDIDKEIEKANDPNGNFINYVNKETMERIFDGSNIFIKLS